MKKAEKEFTVKFPWGNVALVGWGNPANPPILLVHGYMDTAATFIPLVDLLPDTYYYVGFDMPGHGKSDPFEPGLVASQIHIVEVMRGIVEAMKWKSFIFMCHSMGFIVGVFYNHIYPGKISKMIHMDPGPPIATYYHLTHKLDYFFNYHYENYYGTYARWLAGSAKTMTQDEAAHLLMRNRMLTEEEAAIILSRSLVPAEDGKFRLSWEGRMRKICNIPVSEETFYTVMTQHAPPMLFIQAAVNVGVEPGKEFASHVIDKCCQMQPGCYSITVDGGHDVHFTNPKIVAPHIVDFLKDEEKYVKSKL